MPPRFHWNRQAAIMVFLVAAGFLNGADRQLISLMKPMLQADLGWSDYTYGQMASVFQLAAAFGLIGAGWFVDRVGLRAAFPLGVGAWSLAAMAHGVVHTVGQFTGVRIWLGATEAIGTPATIKAIATFYPPSGRAVALGAMNVYGALGAMLVPILVPVMALTFGWRATFLIAGGVGSIWVLGWMLCSRWILEPVADGSATPAADTRVSVRAVLADRATWAVAGGKVFSDQMYWFLVFWMPDLLRREFGLGLGAVGAPLAVIAGLTALGGLAGGYASSRLLDRGMAPTKARRLVMLACALLALALPTVLHTSNVWIAVSLLCLVMAAHQGFSVNLFALTADITALPRVATTIGVAAFFGNLGGMFVLQASGWMLENRYGYGPLLAFLAVSYLLALAWIQAWLPRVRTGA
jgi:ACS family hexuronate transporter-like MFS transporter